MASWPYQILILSYRSQRTPLVVATQLLFTNKNITPDNDAYEIYLIYLKRSKIEYVFKLLKDGLGWEDVQIKDFKGIQSLLSKCFYISSYLYEIGEEHAFDDYTILLAEIGGGIWGDVIQVWCWFR